MEVTEASVAYFPRGVRFRHDAVRQQWVLMAPERALVPDATATEILRRVDGVASIAAIVDELAVVFAAPRHLIAADTLTLVRELVGDGVLRV